MINLIPNQEKKKMVRDFYLRLVTVFLVALAVSLFIATVAIMPAYLLSNTKRESANEKLTIQRGLPLPKFDQDNLAVVQDLNKKLLLIETINRSKFVVSDRVVNAIIAKKGPEIKIRSISYQDEQEKGRSISIRGSATSREILLAFRQALENDPAFKAVDLPISNFIKGKDIQFSLNLIPS